MTEKISKKEAKGPHGVGDPEDKSLRKVEMEVLIPKKMREIAHKEKCVKEVADFSACAKANGLAMVVKCRPENTVLWDCIGKWYNDPEFRERCTTEYLAERTEYRATGVRRKARNLRAEANAEAKTEPA